MTKAQTWIRDHGPGLGPVSEPPIRIELMTYALRVRSGIVVGVVAVLIELPLTSLVVRHCSSAWLLDWLLGRCELRVQELGPGAATARAVGIRRRSFVVSSAPSNGCCCTCSVGSPGPRTTGMAAGPLKLRW